MGMHNATSTSSVHCGVHDHFNCGDSGVLGVAVGCVQGLLQRLASATQPFNFRVLSDNPAAARHIAEATVNTGTHEQLLRAAVAAIVRPSSRCPLPACYLVHFDLLCHAACILQTY